MKTKVKRGVYVVRFAGFGVRCECYLLCIGLLCGKTNVWRRRCRICLGGIFEKLMCEDMDSRNKYIIDIKLL